MRLTFLLPLALLLFGCLAADGAERFVQTGTLSASEAHQAAATDEAFVYAISSKTVAKYDRATGERVSVSMGEAKHLNSGFFRDGKLYCAHSNYPQKPEKSEIMVLDPESMELTSFKKFTDTRGSLTWVVYEEGFWWCTFAHYGAENGRTVLVKFDEQWREHGTWTYPPEVIRELGRFSVSGGIWSKGDLLVTGHDRRAIYRLRLPESGNVLTFVAVLPSPFPGQGIAHDLSSGGLVGIDRAKRQIVFGQLQAD